MLLGLDFASVDAVGVVEMSGVGGSAAEGEEVAGILVLEYMRGEKTGGGSRPMRRSFLREWKIGGVGGRVGGVDADEVIGIGGGVAR